MKLLKEEGIKINSLSSKIREFDCNDNFFYEIKTEIQAYWLGFIATDGSIQNNDIRIELEKQPSEYLHLNTFLNHIGGKHDVKESSKSYRVQVNSKDMVYDLLKYNIHENKVWTVSPPNLDQGLMNHYWRGCVDGDGWVYSNTIEVGLCGNISMVKGFRDYCLTVDRKIKANIVPSKRSYTFRTYNGGAINVLNSLYRNCQVVLSRKYDQYSQIIGGK